MLIMYKVLQTKPAANWIQMFCKPGYFNDMFRFTLELNLISRAISDQDPLKYNLLAIYEIY